VENYNTPLWIAVRIIAAAFAVYAALLAIAIVYGVARSGYSTSQIISSAADFGAAAIFVSIMCGLFAIRAHVPSVRRHLRYAVIFGLVLGIAAFVAGFFIGPVTAQSPQAPLFAFILAPIGFSVGCIAGAVYCYVRAC